MKVIKKLKTIIISSLIILTCILSVLVPFKSAHAASYPYAPSTLVGEEVGAYGIYGAVAVLVANEVKNAIDSPLTDLQVGVYKAIWNAAAPSVKSGVLASYDAAVSAGKKTFDLTQDFIDYVSSSLSGVASNHLTSSHTSTYGDIRISKFDNGKIEHTEKTGYEAMMVYDNLRNTVYTDFYGCAYSFTSPCNIESYNSYYTDDRPGTAAAFYDFMLRPVSGSYFGMSADAIIDNYNTYGDMLTGHRYSLYYGTHAEVAADLEYLQAGTNNKDYYSSQIDDVLANTNTGTTTLALPEIVAHPIDGAGVVNTNKDLYPSIDGASWTYPDTTPYIGNVGFDTPAINTGIDGTVGISQPATGVITDAVTGDVVDTGTDTGTATGTATDTGLLTDIATGISTITGKLTTGLVGDPNNFRFDKLKNIAGGFTHAFPFSLPWDIGNAYNAVFGSISGQNVPDYSFTIHNVTFHLTIPDAFVNLFPYIRSFMLILFNVGLIYSVRKLLGGAS